MDKTYKITHRKGYEGRWKSTLDFISGEAYTSDPAFLAYFRRHPDTYDVQEIKEDTKEEKSEEISEKPKRKTTRKKKEVKSDD